MHQNGHQTLSFYTPPTREKSCKGNSAGEMLPVLPHSWDICGVMRILERRIITERLASARWPSIKRTWKPIQIVSYLDIRKKKE